ncbi:AmmeMemoRadiSam system protein A [Pararhodospirillum oryzae]|uniref:AmmeMemoRadiSam system protein A n=1 Tax=Pararhodospirillum oryzae TaxID=478448 RepID=A0A512H433_9PROT|nr:AmmeMemoRadiSam system protein A [Pararhodospirillum oryzae]GEO80222.1 AmmeMemoRadiSam system protein A [Pararhodospirillum oryzae]
MTARPDAPPPSPVATSPAPAPAPEDLARRATRDHGPRLLALAANAIVQGLDGGAPAVPALASEPAALAEPGAAFVTLTRRAGALRGCIGSVVAHRPLALDVVANAWAAARRDPRFSPVGPDELADLSLSVSVLTTPESFPVADEADLVARVRPGIDGLILSDRGQRGLFLPQVWESLPRPADFITHLKRKAGLPADHWSGTLTIERFEACAVKDPHPWP